MRTGTSSITPSWTTTRPSYCTSRGGCSRPRMCWRSSSWNVRAKINSYNWGLGCCCLYCVVCAYHKGIIHFGRGYRDGRVDLQPHEGGGLLPVSAGRALRIEDAGLGAASKKQVCFVMTWLHRSTYFNTLIFGSEIYAHNETPQCVNQKELNYLDAYMRMKLILQSEGSNVWLWLWLNAVLGVEGKRSVNASRFGWLIQPASSFQERADSRIEGS